MSLLLQLKSPFTEPFPASPGTRVPTPPPTHPGGTHAVIFKQTHSRTHAKSEEKCAAGRGGEENERDLRIKEGENCAMWHTVPLNWMTLQTLTLVKRRVPTRLSYRYTVLHSSITSLLCRGLQVHTRTHTYIHTSGERRLFLTGYAEC